MNQEGWRESYLLLEEAETQEEHVDVLFLCFYLLLNYSYCLDIIYCIEWYCWIDVNKKNRMFDNVGNEDFDWMIQGCV
jgi:hypothetical protein